MSSDGRSGDAEVPVVLECNVRPHTRHDLDSWKIHVMWHRNYGGHQLFQEKRGLLSLLESLHVSRSQYFEEICFLEKLC